MTNGVQTFGEVEAVQGVEEKEGADSVVEIFRSAAEGVERVALCEEFFERGLRDEIVERAVARFRVGRGDEREEAG